MKRKTKIIIPAVSIIFLLLISGCGCKQQNSHQYNVSLEIWGPLDIGDSLSQATDNFKKINPNITSITYKKFATDTYQKELTDALASGQGPDIFLINNTWLPSFEDKIIAAPIDPKVLNEQKFRNNFIDVAANDFLDGGKIYAVPLSVDSLALYYNRDLFNEAGITAPPSTWYEFVADVHKLTKISAANGIIQAGAALGTAYNINRSTDILNLLMLQEGANMIDDSGRIQFDSASLNSSGQSIAPGKEALDFYTRFAQSGSLYYTWNPNMHYSVDAFSEGTVAMMINYSWHMATISSKSPKLNFGIAPVPQLSNDNKVNFANYFGFAVAKNKIPTSDPYGNTSGIAQPTSDQRVAEAWKFLTYLSTKPDGTFTASSGGFGFGNTDTANFDPAADYLKKSGEPAARRDLIQAQMSDPKLGPFASGNLIAKSWREADPTAIENIFAQMIDAVNRGQATSFEALQTAAQRVQQLYNK